MKDREQVKKTQFVWETQRANLNSTENTQNHVAGLQIQNWGFWCEFRVVTFSEKFKNKLADRIGSIGFHS